MEQIKPFVTQLIYVNAIEKKKTIFAQECRFLGWIWYCSLCQIIQIQNGPQNPRCHQSYTDPFRYEYVFGIIKCIDDKDPAMSNLFHPLLVTFYYTELPFQTPTFAVMGDAHQRN